MRATGEAKKAFSPPPSPVSRHSSSPSFQATGQGTAAAGLFSSLPISLFSSVVE